MPRRPRGCSLGMLLLAMVASGCASAASEPATRTVTVHIHHSRFSIESLDVRAGTTVRFVLENSDPIPHELIVGDRVTQDLHESGTEAHHGDRDGEVSVGPGATGETSYTFSRQERLLFGCHLPGHWDYGMRGTIDVR